MHCVTRPIVANVPLVTRTVRTATLLGLAAVLAACGGPAHRGTPSTTPSSSTASSTTTTAAGPAGGPVPAGFVPQSFTAVSDSTYWVLGTAPCAAGTCPTLVRTTDGGASFVSIPAPSLSPSAGQQATVRFADSRDGFVFVSDGPSPSFFTTHDGGASWHAQSLGDVLSFAAGAGTAFVVTGQCGGSGCSNDTLRRSPVGSDTWSSGPLPFTPDGPNVDLEAHGTSLWLLGTPTSANSPHGGVLARSSDGGRTFTVGQSPCVPGLGGHLAATSATNLWALCPTGTEAGAWRSTDGGVTFTGLRTPPLNNSAVIAPASADVAVLSPNDSTGALLRTTDGGATWAPVDEAGAKFWVWIGFTDGQVGAAVVQTGSQSEGGALPSALWRTTDAGAHWSVVHFS